MCTLTVLENVGYLEIFEMNEHSKFLGIFLLCLSVCFVCGCGDKQQQIISKGKDSFSASYAGTTSEKVLYAELTPHEFRERLAAAPIAYLPLGTLEFHGEHLPLGSDGLQSQGVFTILAQEIGGIVCPMLFLGPDLKDEMDGKEYYGMDLGYFLPEYQRYPTQQLTGSAYWVSNETFDTIIDNVLKQLKRAGFNIVVAHGHGPSITYFWDHHEQWEKKFGLKLFILTRTGELGIMSDHAAVNETSLVMALRPDLVEMDRLPKDTNIWPVGIGSGTEKADPRIYANAEIGWKTIRLEKERIAKVLHEAMRKLN